MADFPALWTPGTFDWSGVIAAVSPDNIYYGAGASSAAWPSANLAIYVPVRVTRVCTIYKMAFGCGTTAGGNADVGLFTWAGVKLVSTGSTARSASSEVIVDVTDTTIGPGRYWLGMAANGTDNYSVLGSALNAGLGKMCGMRQQATAFVLPSTATFATSAQSLIPACAAYLRSE